MATTSPNLGLTLPSSSDRVSRTAINGNWTILDTAIGAVPSGTSLMDKINVVTAPNGTQYRIIVSNDGTLSTEAI